MAKTEPITLETAIIGVLAMLAAAREDELAVGRKPEERRKTEVVLADAGFSPAQIGQILHKKGNTVAKTIARARKQTTGKDGDD